jgi:hypothetical protein
MWQDFGQMPNGKSSPARIHKIRGVIMGKSVLTDDVYDNEDGPVWVRRKKAEKLRDPAYLAKKEKRARRSAEQTSANDHDGSDDPDAIQAKYSQYVPYKPTKQQNANEHAGLTEPAVPPVKKEFHSKAKSSARPSTKPAPKMTKARMKFMAAAEQRAKEKAERKAAQRAVAAGTSTETAMSRTPA